MAGYLARDLDRKATQRLEKHLGGCSDCPAFLSTYEKTARAVQSLGGGDINGKRISAIARILLEKAGGSFTCH